MGDPPPYPFPVVRGGIKASAGRRNASSHRLARLCASGMPMPCRFARLPSQEGEMHATIPSRCAVRFSNGAMTANGRAKFTWGAIFPLLKQTFNEWLEDKAPQLGAALAYYTVFSLAPLILVLLAIIGVLFRNDPSGAWTRMTEQMSYFLDKSALDVVQQIAQKASQAGKSTLATIIGVVLAIFGASGVFGQLQEALNTVWGVKAKPGLGLKGFLRARFLSFTMVAGVCFLLLVSLVVEGMLKGFSHWVQTNVPGGLAFATTVYVVFDMAVVILLFVMMFKYLPDVKVRWRDVSVGSIITAVLF